MGWKSESLLPSLPGATRQNLRRYTSPMSYACIGFDSTIRQALGMAPIEKKRHRDLASFKAKKRRRIELENDNSQEDPDGRAVGLDRLPWSQVPVDRLEDAEGFFGLEELSNVDVVRDPTLGKVEYKVCKKVLHRSRCAVY